MNKLKNPLVIVANGTFPTHNTPIEKIKKAASILACDGATDSLIENGYTPNLIIGDLDSISEDKKKQFKDIIIEDNNQTSNDLRKAIDYAKKNNINNISILGATGKREDHTIGNIFSLLDYKDLNIKLYTNTGIFSCIHGSQNIESFKGQQVSIFAPDTSIKITSKYLKYNFNNNSISSLFCGTLNKSIGSNFSLKLSHGNILIFQSYR